MLFHLGVQLFFCSPCLYGNFFLAQTDESACLPFIKGDVRCLKVQSLEVKYKEHKHRDHTARCRPEAWLLKVLLYPASHTQTKTLHLLCQLTTWDVSLCWQRKRDPLLDQGGWVLVPALPPQRITPLAAASSSSSTTQPPSSRKAGLCPWLLAPTICLIGCICVMVSRPGALCGARPSEAPSD